MDIDDLNAKKLYTEMGQQLKLCTNMLQSRINYIMDEEPQYRTQNQQDQVNKQAEAIEKLEHLDPEL